MTVQCIAEGHGETKALPALMGRLAAEGGVFDLQIPDAQRGPVSGLSQASELPRYLERAAAYQPDAILVLFDADEFCPITLWSGLKECVETFRIPTGLVIAKCEYEAWFLACLSSMRDQCGVASDAEDHPSPEVPRDAKKVLTTSMPGSRAYGETTDQLALTRRIDLAKAHARCRSFRKLTAEFGELLERLGRPPLWPDAWRQHGV